MSTRTVVIVGVVVALVIAGFLGSFASSHPDALEYVAQRVGFHDTADEHAAADGPMADYMTRGIENQWLSHGVAGVTGSLAVLTLTGALLILLRRGRPNRDG
jgi:hypothetical protein